MKNFWHEFKASWKHAVTHIFKINGKASRTEYNCVMIPMLLGVGILQGLADFLINDHHAEIGFYIAMFALLYILILLVGTFCLVGRRNRDVGVSKWYAILMLIPQLGYVYLVILMIMKPNFKFHLFPHHHKYLGE